MQQIISSLKFSNFTSNLRRIIFKLLIINTEARQHQMIHKILVFWLRHIHSRLATLIATIGTVGLAVFLLIIFVLGRLFEEVIEREAFSFDTSLLLWLHGQANPTLDRVMLTITQFGNPRTVVFVVIVSLAMLWWRNRQEAKIFALACLGAVILNTGLKLAFSKPRPHLWHL